MLKVIAERFGTSGLGVIGVSPTLSCYRRWIKKVVLLISRLVRGRWFDVGVCEGFQAP
jgi:hypothetical protein